MKEGDAFEDPLLPPCPLNGAELDLKEEVRDGSPRSLSVGGDDHSLSVAIELAVSSTSSAMLLPRPPPLADPEPEARLRVDEDALLSRSFAFSFSSMSLNILVRASAYAASLSAIVIYFLLVVLRLPILPVSDRSWSERSQSSPVTDAGCDMDDF